MISSEQTKFIQQFSNMSQTSATPSDGKTAAAATMINLKKNSSSTVQVASGGIPANSKPPIHSQDNTTATTEIMSLRKDQQALSSSKRSLLKSGGQGVPNSQTTNTINAATGATVNNNGTTTVTNGSQAVTVS